MQIYTFSVFYVLMDYKHNLFKLRQNKSFSITIQLEKTESIKTLIFATPNVFLTNKGVICEFQASNKKHWTTTCNSNRNTVSKIVGLFAANSIPARILSFSNKECAVIPPLNILLPEKTICSWKHYNLTAVSVHSDYVCYMERQKDKNSTLVFQNSGIELDLGYEANVLAFKHVFHYAVASTKNYKTKIYHGNWAKYVANENINTNYWFNTLIPHPCQLGFIQLDDNKQVLFFIKPNGEIWKKYNLNTYDSSDNWDSPHPVAIQIVQKDKLCVTYSNGLLKVLHFFCDPDKVEAVKDNFN